MRGPFELLGDLYDYQYNYYRWFVHRRLVFSDISATKVLNDLRFNIFRNKDYENINRVVGQTTLCGFTGGIAFASGKYFLLRELKKQTFRQSLPACLAILVVSSKSNF
jgi:hypothetical protein